MKTLSLKIALCIFFIAGAFHFTQAQSINSDFSSSADSWTIFNTSSGSSTAATYLSTGGNPGGYITDGGTTGGGTMLYAEAPAKFRGDLSLAYKLNLTFDLKTSFVGTDNTNGDVVLSGGGVTLFYQLPSKPATTFTSYTIALDETFTGWHYGSPSGAVPSQMQMKMALSNITSLRIRTKYVTSNTFTVTGSVDNVFLHLPLLASPPIISSILPTNALPGASVVINGFNFNTTLSQNTVYFEGVKATVLNASATQLTVRVPNSAPYGLITVENASTGLQGTSTQSFSLLFDNNKDFGGRIIPASMSRGYYTLLQNGTETSSTYNGFGNMDAGDFDNDGWIDLISTETSSAKIYMYRNKGTGGTVSTSSFASAVALPSLSTVPGGSPTLSQVIVADVDSDGKLDVVASTSGNINLGTTFLAVYRNTSSVGNISFATPQFFALPYYSALTIAAGDLDNDGRIDFMSTSGSSPSNLWINHNLSSPGNIDFAYGKVADATSTSGYNDIVVGDLNGDGRSEIIASGYNAATLSVYENNSTLGDIAMKAPFTIPAAIGRGNMAIADLDADNKLDLVWSTYGAQYIYFTKNIFSGPTFNATSFGTTIQIPNVLSNPEGIAVSDINSDGKPDVIASGYSDICILQNVGAANSLSASSFLTPVVIQGSATGQALAASTPIVADLDGDNKAEVFFNYTNNVTVGEKAIFIFHNENFPVPKINTIAPSSGSVSSVVSLTGDLMSTASSTPIVRLGSILSAINSNNNTSTSITIPSGSKSDKFNLTLHGLTGFSSVFPTTFNTNRQINSSSFGAKVNFAIGINPQDALSVADFDDDGMTDVALIAGGSAQVFKNSGTVGSTITTASLTSMGSNFSSAYNLTAFDIDGDGKTDLHSGYGLFQNSSTTGNISFLSGPNGIYTSSGSFNNTAIGDFNNDGKADMANVNGTGNIQVYENQSSRGVFVNGASSYLSTFSPVVNFSKVAPSGGIVAADFDGDNYDDLIATNPQANSITIYLNTATYGKITTASFSLTGSPTVGTSPYGIAASDFDGDGKTDIAITYFNQSYISVLRNTSTTGNISFAASVDVACNNKGYAISSQDLDGDGIAEIVTIHQPNPGPGSFSVFKNKSTSGTISFNSPVNFALTNNPQAIAVADINSDQKPDILIVGSGGTGQVLSVFENKMIAPTLSVVNQPQATYSVCDGATPTISTLATGTTNITYQWQIFNAQGNNFIDIGNTGGYSNTATSSLTINTTGNFGAGTYRCKISGDFASTIYSNSVSVTVNPIPSAPQTTDVNNCGPKNFALTATGANNGNYLWYDQNGLINGENNSTYTTPVISSTQVYYVAITNGTCVSLKSQITATINTIPTAPTASDVSNCGNGILTLTAAGGTNGNYVWYNQSGVINGEVNSTYLTPQLSASTGYQVAVTNGACTSTKTSVNAIINTIPSAPTTTDASVCANTSATLVASGGTDGQYRWYMISTGGTAINGEVNGSLTIASLTTTTTYYVSIFNGTCESNRMPVTANVKTTGCSQGTQNSPPVIDPITEQTSIGGEVTVNLSTIISDPDNNLDLSTLVIIKQPDSKAIASLDANKNLVVNYSGIVFSGTDHLTIQICDMDGACSQKVISIEVAGKLVVYNAVSPNGDNKNDFLFLQYIDLISNAKENKVSIYNRWGDEVFSVNNYNNTTHVFSGLSNDGKLLPTGTYFYKVSFSSELKPVSGYFEINY